MPAYRKKSRDGTGRGDSTCLSERARVRKKRQERHHLILCPRRYKSRIECSAGDPGLLLGLL